ncbi:MAG: haloacid dehalogenase-like hydrolase [Bdellovibrionales bacterium]|nr:haloacid dehalogenase-like hydrolase [Bdellovibrionales bacterium]
MYRYQVKPFSDEFWDILNKKIESIKHREKPPYVAAFDADGTLWDIDVGELFFEYQIGHSNLILPDEPYETYIKMREEKPFEALVWLAQINSGHSLKKVRSWAHDCFRKLGHTIPVLPPMTELIEHLYANDFEVYIVTASVKWSIEPFGQLFSVPPEKVIGTTTHVIDGIITDKEDLITYQEKKVDGVMKYIGRRPHLAAGNAFSDRFLIESATDINIAIQSSPVGHLHQSELKTRDLALEKGWLSHCFY